MFIIDAIANDFSCTKLSNFILKQFVWFKLGIQNATVVTLSKLVVYEYVGMYLQQETVLRGSK